MYITSDSSFVGDVVGASQTRLVFLFLANISVRSPQILYFLIIENNGISVTP